MTAGTSGGASEIPRRWADLQRVEAWAGEARVNLVRAVALAAFYGHLLFRVRFLGDSASGGTYLEVVSLVVAAWAALVVGLRRMLAERFVPPWLPLAVVAVDLGLVTLLLFAGTGPRSSLVVLYLLVVASSGLRLRLDVVRFATGLAFALYLVVVAWGVGIRPEHRIAHADQVVFMLAVLLTGAVAGQAVRQARRLVEGLPVDIEEAS